MKRLIALLLIALLLSGCASESTPYIPTGNALDATGATRPVQTPEKTQSLALAWYPDRSMNPFQCTDYTNRALFSLIYQGLFALNSQGEPVPILCDSYHVSEDMKTWSFQLAEAFFSDGTAVTAADVAASYEAATAGPYYAGRLQHVESVYPLGETLVITLDTPMERLVWLLDIPVVKASQVDAENPLGSGPYQLGEGVLRRQAGWWCSAQLPTAAEQITLVEVTSPADIRNAFQEGRISLVCADPGDVDYVDFQVDYELWDCDTGLFLYLACNETSTVFSDPAIRRALSSAMDRNRICQRFYHSLAYPAVLPAEPGSDLYSQVLAQSVVQDTTPLTEAVAALDQNNRSVTLLYNGDDQLRVWVAQDIAQVLEGCGLTVKLEKATTETFVKQLKKGKYDLYLGQTKLSANMDTSAFFGSNTTLNYGGMDDMTLYELSMSALANIGNYYTLHRQILEKGQLCPLVMRGYAVYVRRGVLEGLSPARDNIFYYDLGRTLSDALSQGE